MENSYAHKCNICNCLGGERFGPPGRPACNDAAPGSGWARVNSASKVSGSRLGRAGGSMDLCSRYPPTEGNRPRGWRINCGPGGRVRKGPAAACGSLTGQVPHYSSRAFCQRFRTVASRSAKGPQAWKCSVLGFTPCGRPSINAAVGLAPQRR